MGLLIPCGTQGCAWASDDHPGLTKAKCGNYKFFALGPRRPLICTVLVASLEKPCLPECERGSVVKCRGSGGCAPAYPTRGAWGARAGFWRQSVFVIVRHCLRLHRSKEQLSRKLSSLLRHSAEQRGIGEHNLIVSFPDYAP